MGGTSLEAAGRRSERHRKSPGGALCQHMLIAGGFYPCLRLLQRDRTTQSYSFGQVAVAVMVDPNIARAVGYNDAASPEQVESC